MSETEQPAAHVLTPEEATTLLTEVHDYFSKPKIEDKHPSVKAADNLFNEGRTEAASNLHTIHKAMQNFHAGNYQAIQAIDTGIVKSLSQNAIRSSFVKYTDQVQSQCQKITDVLEQNSKPPEIDWEQSKDVILSAKQANFPEDLSFSERLDKWANTKSATSRAV